MKHRDRLAQETRARVAAAARILFAEAGYVQTSVGAISAASGVPEQTIYSSFGNKPAILEEVRLGWIAEAGVAALHAEAMQLTSAPERLARAAHWTRRQFELGHDVIAVYQEAARTDPRAEEAWRQALEFREAAVRTLLRPIASAFRPGLTTRRAVDLYVALTVPEIYRELVVSRGWRPAAYEEWLSSALTAALLG
jgi:AcrR family transcriptional regulator